MHASLLTSGRKSLLCFLFLLTLSAQSLPATTWRGVLRDHAGKPVGGATVGLRGLSEPLQYSAQTSSNGEFLLPDIKIGVYGVAVEVAGRTYTAEVPITSSAGPVFAADLELPAQGQTVAVVTTAENKAAKTTGGEKLSAEEVSSLPLNERDFSKLLLLAAGTMTDTNGAANFTQQFTVNGQRGMASVFAMDGADSSDPEMGGATFSNFNVDAIQEVQSSSGVMPAEIGHGAAGFTNVITKSGTEQIHGSVFEFVRNAAFDARNFFDHDSVVEPAAHSSVRAQRIWIYQWRARWCSPAFTMGAGKRFISGSIRASARSWAPRKFSRCPRPTNAKGSIPQHFLATR